jgi:signal transduction histidine kinase
MDQPPVRTRRVFGVVMLATLVIFGGLLGGLTWQLRTRLRAEVLRREAEAIHAVALMQLGRGANLAQFGAEFALDDLFAAVLESASLRGVLAVQLFDGTGRLRQARPLAPDDAEARRWWALEPAAAEAHFHAHGSLDRVSPQLAVRAGADERLPLVEIVVPLRQPGMAGVALYWVDGTVVAQEFSRMDARLAVQGGVVFAGGALLVALVLGWAFARLAEANRRLEAQRTDLARANEELDFAAKTGALGAISAHLIHGLKNPLAGIEGFVAESAEGGVDARSGEAVRHAVQTTQRLRALVNEVTTVLRDEADGGDSYAVPVEEVVEAARRRTAMDAAAKDVRIAVSAAPGLQVGARCANLAGLVIANLVTNALEASAAGGEVMIEAVAEGPMVGFRIRDAGPGLPPAVRAGLFRPVRSAKRGGGGVGLAISHRLARHAGGSLELGHSGPGGTEFRLLVPAFTAG